MRKYLIFVFILSNWLHGEETMSFWLKSGAFKEHQAIPSKYTFDGENVSPPLSWNGAPEGTKSFALIVDDPDEVKKVWTHWVVFNIPPTTTHSDEGSPPEGSIQGNNDFEKAYYRGPRPPSGNHRYFFKLYALNAQLQLPRGATKEQVEAAMKGHILAETQLIGTYARVPGS